MTGIWLDNLAIYSLQLAVVVAAATAAAAALRVRAPAAVVVYWQAVLAVGLLLPVVQPWRAATGPSLLAAAGGGAAQAEPGASAVSLVAIVALALACGGVVRAARLATGLRALGRLRRHASPAPLPDEVAAARDLVGADAEILISPEVMRPSAFGIRRPVVLLPTSVLDLDAACQRAVVCHELIHVRRRDWAFAVAEEAVLAALWFHPAVWWLVGRIQLFREQAVDAEVVALGVERRPYAETLLAFARAKAGAAHAVAPSFFSQSHLARRVEVILKEVVMSKRRIAVSLAVMAAAVFTAAGSVARALPLYAPVAVAAAQEEVDVTPTRKVDPVYPPEAKAQKLSGEVQVNATIDAAGRVIDAKAVTGPQVFHQPAEDAMRQWTFANKTGKKVALTVTFVFRPEK